MDRKSDKHLKIKQMTLSKFTVLAAILIFVSFISCTESVKEKGQITLKSGDGKDISVEYEIDSLAGFTPKYSMKDLISISEQLSKRAEDECKFPLTYEPKRIIVFFKNGELATGMDFTAKNAFGTPIKGVLYGKYKGTVLGESF